MNRTGMTLTDVLIGALEPDVAPATVLAVMSRGGIPVGDVIVLEGADGLAELQGHDRRSGVSGRLRHVLRHLDALDEAGTGRVLAEATADLARGTRWVMGRHVAKRGASWRAALLRHAGVSRPSYLGRWTVGDQTG